MKNITNILTMLLLINTCNIFAMYNNKRKKIREEIIEIYEKRVEEPKEIHDHLIDIKELISGLELEKLEIEFKKNYTCGLLSTDVIIDKIIPYLLDSPKTMQNLHLTSKNLYNAIETLYIKDIHTKNIIKLESTLPRVFKKICTCMQTQDTFDTQEFTNAMQEVKEKIQANKIPYYLRYKKEIAKINHAKLSDLKKKIINSLKQPFQKKTTRIKWYKENLFKWVLTNTFSRDQAHKPFLERDNWPCCLSFELTECICLFITNLPSYLDLSGITLMLLAHKLPPTLAILIALEIPCCIFLLRIGWMYISETTKKWSSIELDKDIKQLEENQKIITDLITQEFAELEQVYSFDSSSSYSENNHETDIQRLNKNENSISDSDDMV